MAFTEEQEAELSRAAELDAKELIKVEGTKMKLSKELMSQYVIHVQHNRSFPLSVLILIR